jgi:folate-binding protein YgfZ
MPDLLMTPLPRRALLSLKGDDRVGFLQGLVSADVTKASAERALYGAYLTPQGKFLYDFFLAAGADALVLEVEAEGRDDFRQRLARFRLRSKIALADQDEWQVLALYGADAAAAFGLEEAGAARAFAGGMVMADPRRFDAGLRAWLPRSALPEVKGMGFAAAGWDEWDRRRIELGLADGRRDMVADKTILLEAGFDELNGVDWQKGCFMGQEVTARSKYRGQIKKRLLPVAIAGPPPAPGTPIFAGDREAGEMRSHCGEIGLAMLRLDCLDGRTLTAAGATLTPRPPQWVRLSL